MSGDYKKWKNTKSYGKQIEGTRMIAFKTPQERGFSNDPKERFTVNDLLEAIPNLGVVIDLTFTAKYYNPEILVSNGISYVKMYIEGKSVPHLMYLVKFCRIIESYTAKNKNNKLIGIHCTHGLNRTGYMVCSYMIKCLGIAPKEAIKRFESARGILIENRNYLNELSILKPSFKLIDLIEGDRLINQIPVGRVIFKIVGRDKKKFKSRANNEHICSKDNSKAVNSITVPNASHRKRAASAMSGGRNSYKIPKKQYN